jgi:polar amino acid transport system permease protein
LSGAERAAIGLRSAPDHFTPAGVLPPTVVHNRGVGDPPEQPHAIKAIPIRHWGRLTASVIILIVVLLLAVSLGRNPNLKWDVVGRYLFADFVLRGVAVTLELTLLAMLIGTFGGTLLAIMRLSKNYVLQTVSWFYIWFFRGTPVYVQIIFWGNFALLYRRLSLGIPFTDHIFWSLDSNAVITILVASVLALGLNEAAYAAELVRAGIISVDRGQTEAAASLGMSSGLTMRRIVLPQAMRIIIPPMGNETISMLKTTSLVSVISAHELMTNVQIVYSQNLLVIPLLLVASIWYIFVTTLLTIGQHYLEAYFGRGFGDKETAAAEKRAMKRLERKAGVDPGVF